MSVGMQQYVRELSARLPRVAPEHEYVRYARGGNFGWSEQIALPLWVARSGAQLVHFMSVYTPLLCPARSVVTIHDLIHLRFPEQFKKSVGPYYRTVVRRACARAARVITDDDRTVEDLAHYLAVDPAKVRVIPLGVAPRPASVRQLPQSARPYLLYVGNHRPHKSIETLLDAWHALPQDYDVDLLLTGPDDFSGALQRASTSRRTATALGDLSDEELTERYQRATALVHPALREGFGLPMLEAMAMGTPVVACETAVPRVLQPAVLTFAPRDVGMLSSRLVEILHDAAVRERLVERGRAIAGGLSWDHCARRTADVYDEALR
jgi:glycosyltransferase involved in cell wall biosynthesis